MTEFISRNYGHKEYEIIIKTDSADHYRATVAFARRLIDHAKLTTNLEHYQRMSAEEFAERFFESICLHIPCSNDGDCDKCMINYLNAEYKENDKT